jgi:hypothetical protein
MTKNVWAWTSNRDYAQGGKISRAVHGIMDGGAAH